MIPYRTESVDFSVLMNSATKHNLPKSLDPPRPDHRRWHSDPRVRV